MVESGSAGQYLANVVPCEARLDGGRQGEGYGGTLATAEGAYPLTFFCRKIVHAATDDGPAHADQRGQSASLGLSLAFWRIVM